MWQKFNLHCSLCILVQLFFRITTLNNFRLSGISPFHANTPRETLLKVKTGEWEFDKAAFANITDEAKDFIQKLLVKEPRYEVI